MQSVQSTTETGKLDGIRESEKCIHRLSMCRGEMQGVLSAQLRSPWASKQCVLHILHMPLARCRTMRAEPVRPLLTLPAPRLLRQPMRAGAKLRQRTPAASVLEGEKVARQSVGCVGPGGSNVLTDAGALRSVQLLAEGSCGSLDNVRHTHRLGLAQIHSSPICMQRCCHLTSPRLPCQPHTPGLNSQCTAVL